MSALTDNPVHVGVTRITVLPVDRRNLTCPSVIYVERVKPVFLPMRQQQVSKPHGIRSCGRNDGRYAFVRIPERASYNGRRSANPQYSVMTLDGLQKILADKYKRRIIKNKQYYPKVNLVRYADDFIITSENREVLEREIKPPVTEFLAERGLTLSDEKAVITGIREGFDFLGFNIRKFKKQLLTKPSGKAQKRFLEKVRTTIKSNKACKQMSLIRLGNPIITGWGNYSYEPVLIHK